MNTYDLTVVLDGKTTQAKKKTAIEKIEGLIKVFEGSVGEIKDWGERDLAYPIQKHETGIYLIFPVEVTPDGAKRMQDKIRLEEYILRHLMIKNDQETKKVNEKSK